MNKEKKRKHLQKFSQQIVSSLPKKSPGASDPKENKEKTDFKKGKFSKKEKIAIKELIDQFSLVVLYLRLDERV